MKIPKDKQCYIDACLPDNTPHNKGIGKGFGIKKKPIPVKIIPITAQESKERYRYNHLMRLIDRG